MGYDLITVGRVTMDLQSQDIGVPFEEVTRFATSVGGSPTNIAIAAAPARSANHNLQVLQCAQRRRISSSS